MHRRNAIVALLGLSVTLGTKVRRAAAWTLVTEDEFNEVSKAARPESAAAPPSRRDDIPVIEVIEPDLKKPISPPVKIRIRFQAPAGASINPASFRATYGWFNITDRLVAHAKIDSSGISADNAEIPAGKYKITLQIADDQGRVGTGAFDFQVL